jgi:tetratricopeptide (TPR) repeat protein
MALTLCPQLQDAVNSLAHLLMDQRRFDEAVATVQQAELDDPRNEAYGPMLDVVNEARTYGKREQELRAALAKSPQDVQINLDLARLLQDEGKFPELDDRLRTAASLTNWSHEAMVGIIQYYVDQMHNPEAAIAFLEARARIDPKAGELIYSLAALDSSVGRNEEALKYLTQAVAVGGTNAIMSARIDPRFEGLREDARFQALVGAPPAGNPPPVNKPATNPPGTVLPKPVKK